MNSTSSGWDGLLNAFGSVLSSVATGAGQILATNAVSGGRTPTTQVLANPLTIPAGTAGQPNTVPVVPATIVPGVANGTLFLGLGVLAVGAVVLIVARR